MNIRDLEYVLAVAEYRSFSRAAAACHVSQPSLSAQVRKLEDELRQEIFVRSPRGVTLTGFGDSLLPLAQTILTTAAGIHQLARNGARDQATTLSLGAIHTVAPYVFPKIIGALKKNMDSVTFTFKEGQTDSLLKDLLDGSLDAALISLPTDSYIFTQQEVFTEPFYIAVAKTNPLAKRKSLTPAQLQTEPFYLLEDGHCLREQALDICHHHGALGSNVFRATSLETIRHMIAVGSGVTLMPHISMQKNDGLAYLTLQGRSYSRTIGLVWRKNSAKGALLTRIAALIAAKMAR